MREEFFVICQTCKVRYTFDIDPEDYYAFRHGTFAQSAFPYLTPGQRELMVSQTCDTCFNRMFPPDDEITDVAWINTANSLDELFKKLGPTLGKDGSDNG